jgi:hypothetical protein
MELVKNLEDEVASGSTLREISDKFDLKLVSRPKVSMEDIERDDMLSPLKSQIFGMEQSEVSYPIEIPNSQNIAIVEISAITPSKPEDFEENQRVIAAKWQESEKANLAIKLMQEVLSKAPSEFESESRKNNFNISQNVRLERAKLYQNEQYPSEMLLSIFETKIRDNQNSTQNPVIISNIFRKGAKLFIAKVIKAELNKDISKKIESTASENIIQKIDTSLFTEVMGYLRDKEHVRIDDDSVVFKENQ